MINHNDCPYFQRVAAVPENIVSPAPKTSKKTKKNSNPFLNLEATHEGESDDDEETLDDYTESDLEMINDSDTE